MAIKIGPRHATARRGWKMSDMILAGIGLGLLLSVIGALIII